MARLMNIRELNEVKIKKRFRMVRLMNIRELKGYKRME